MSRAVFKKLSGDLRAEWFQQLTQEAEESPMSQSGRSPLSSARSSLSSPSAPLPKSLLLRGILVQTPGSAGMKTQGLAKLASSTTYFQQYTAGAAAEGAVSHSPTGSADLSDSSNNSGPLSPLPNAPGSGTAARTPAASASTLYNPAISRVLKVDKLNEPYISRRE